jgi:hypothetical protein
VPAKSPTQLMAWSLAILRTAWLLPQMRTAWLMPELRPLSNVPGLLASELQMSRSSRLMRSLPSDAVASVGGSADRPAILASECDVHPLMPRKSMPRSYRGLSLCFIALRASALPHAQAWASFRAVSFACCSGMALPALGWAHGRAEGMTREACRLPVQFSHSCCAISRLPTAREGTQLGSNCPDALAGSPSMTRDKR